VEPEAPRPRPRLSGAERDAAIRAQLKPFGPDERPAAIVIATVVAAALAVANFVLALIGTKVHGYRPSPAGGILYAAVLTIAAVGMWRLRYWAVLGFEVLLALIVLVFALLLVRSSNVEALVISLGIVCAGGWLFWKMVRVMARIQMPTRERPR
jgi:hypothetical protein